MAIMKRIIYLFLGLLLLLAGGWWLTRPALHDPIDPSQVQQVRLRGGATGDREATGEERAQVIAWFNSGSDPRENSALAGATPESSIRITFRDGSHLSLYRSGADFEVQDFRRQKPRYYWLRQPDLRGLLDQLAGRR